MPLRNSITDNGPHNLGMRKVNKRERNLKTTALQKGSWPTNKKDLVREHYRDFVKFINEIPFDKLNAE